MRVMNKMDFCAPLTFSWEERAGIRKYTGFDNYARYFVPDCINTPRWKLFAKQLRLELFILNW